MGFGDSFYCGDAQRVLQVHGPLDGTARNATEVSSHIRSLYDAGEPLYTKDIIRDVSRQLRGGSQKVLVRGLNGTAVDVDMEIGEPYDAGYPDWDYIVYVQINYFP
jgi:hypothetical protein